MKLNDIYIRDPFVLVEGDSAYMFGTTDKNAWAGAASGFIAYHTTDLENFTPHTVFSASADFWSNENFWAPEVHKYKGKYYIFASFKANGVHRCTQLLVCDTVVGTYKPMQKPITPEDWDCLDGTLYVDNGKPYIVFCHEWTQIGVGEICAAPLSEDLSHMISAPITLFKATDAPWAAPINASNNYVTDGPYLKEVGGKLIMLWSGVGKKGYAMGVAQSSGGVLGKWTQQTDALFSSDGGHGMLFSYKGVEYVSLHSPNKPSLSERAKFFKVSLGANGKISLL